MELESLDTDYKDRIKQSTDYLRERYQLEFNVKPIRHDLGNVVHLFSHIRKVYHIEWIQYFHDNDTMMEIDDEKDIKWVTLDEVHKSPIPTGLKKALKLLEKFKVICSVLRH